nr:hypothetical protein [Halorhabdus rudnickae]
MADSKSLCVWVKVVHVEGSYCPNADRRDPQQSEKCVIPRGVLEFSKVFEYGVSYVSLKASLTSLFLHLWQDYSLCKAN